MNLDQDTQQNNQDNQNLPTKKIISRQKQSRSKSFCGCLECDHDHCSLLCRQDLYSEKRRRIDNQKQIDKVLTIPLRNCHIRSCQKLFIPKTGNQKYCCSKCSSMAFRMRYKKDWYLMKDVWIIAS